MGHTRGVATPANRYVAGLTMLPSMSERGYTPNGTAPRSWPPAIWRRH
jgi:hypothetical protein